MTARMTAARPGPPPYSEKQQRELIGPLLKQVSRSFYLTLRVLPSEIRPQISLAYLLARASDTIADTAAVPRAKRILLLRELQPLSRTPDLGALVENQALPAERELLGRLGECLDRLGGFNELDCRFIQQLLQTIIDGQVFDLQTFPGETEQELVALASEADLDRYTYLVAGCVGEFWTRMCAAHLPGLEEWKNGRMEEAGVRFGKGLQLVNILRDLPRDLRIGRCYLPVSEPRTLLDPAAFESIRPLYQHWLDMAVGHLEAGWQYTLRIPPSLWRVRLACTWPIWIGLATIARLRQANPLDSRQRVMVPQGDVNRMLLWSFLTCRRNAALDRRYRQLRMAAQKSL
jgi:farnesyl-diphosphate farnesyltransferase